MTSLPCILRVCLGLLSVSAQDAPQTERARALRDHIEIGGRIFFTDGPIRHPSAVLRDRVYVGSDDGHLYCLDKTGKLEWKFRGGPSERKVLGAGRVISAWNVSGGPVAHQGKVYIAAGTWPVMGIFVYALDAQTGRVVWKNDSSTSIWQSDRVNEGKKDPNFEPSFLSISPNGPCRIEGDRLAVPCGRSSPAYFDLETGELLSFDQGGNRPWVEKHVGELKHPDFDKVATQTQGCFPRDAAADAVLAATGVRDGYCVVLGVGDGNLIKGLVAHSRLRLVVIEPDEAKVRSLRMALLPKAGYRTRCSVHAGDPGRFRLPPYFASLIVVNDEGAIGEDSLRGVLEALRPYGGTMCAPLSMERLLRGTSVANTELTRKGSFALLRRVGPLPGADDWSHEHANAANTRFSRDGLVKSPFGVLWFGGPSSHPRYHYENHRLYALPQVCGGRFFIEGPRMVSCFDAYTGRKLWVWRPPESDKEIWDLDSHAANNQFVQWAFQPIAGRFVSTGDAVYITSGRTLYAVDAATGGPLHGFSFSLKDDWGAAKVVGDHLYIPTASRVLALDRLTGRIQWEHTDSGGTLAAGPDRLFCLAYPNSEWPDRFENPHTSTKSRHLKGFAKFVDLDKLRRRGEGTAARQSRLIALDGKTGKVLWQKDVPAAPRLTYCRPQEMVVGVPFHGQAYGYQAETGEQVWRGRMNLHTVFRDDVLIRSGIKSFMFQPLPSAEPTLLSNPLTGVSAPFPRGTVQLGKTGNGCGPLIAGRHVMTFRSGNAAYYDISGSPGLRSGVNNLGGFRSSCHPSVIPANGLLLAPNAVAGGCRCRYPISMSVAFLHMPGMEKWGSYGKLELEGAIRRIGVNFGAPGDRMAENGTLWLDYPSVGGPSPDVAIRTVPSEPEWFRYHSSRVVDGDGIPWVVASGARKMSSVAISLNTDQAAEYIVRIHYARPAKEGFQNLAGVKVELKLSGKDELTVPLDANCFVCGVEVIEASLASGRSR